MYIILREDVRPQINILTVKVTHWNICVKNYLNKKYIW